MLKDQNPKAMWVPEATRNVFNQIASTTGEDQYQVAARLAEQERKRLARRGTLKP
jgi:hypothetical protein